VLADKRHELLCCYQKCDRINEREQPQNDETRQPIGISACEKLVQKILVIHGGANCRKRRTPTIERPTSNQLQIGDIECQGRESNSRPTPNAFGAALPRQPKHRIPALNAQRSASLEQSEIENRKS
jgi:hypothetical protein